MSEVKNTKEFQPLPRFVDKALNDWIIYAISMFEPKLAAQRFLITFPKFADEALYGPYDDILKKVHNRFLQYNSNTKLKNYEKIQDVSESISMGLDDKTTYMHPMKRIKEYVRMLTVEKLTITQRISLINNIRKEIGIEMIKDAGTYQSDETATKWDKIKTMTEDQDTFSLVKQQRDQERRLKEEIKKYNDEKAD